MTLELLCQNIFVLKRPRVANFADIIKLVATFIKANFQDSSKAKTNRNCNSKYNLY